MTAADEVVARFHAKQRAATAKKRRDFVLFVLESVALDGLPRASVYTCDVLERDGLIEKTGRDDAAPYRLTAEGRIRLAVNPADTELEEEQHVFF